MTASCWRCTCSISIDSAMANRSRCVFIERIRDEKKFDSFDELREQIFRDASVAEELLMRESSPCIGNQA